MKIEQFNTEEEVRQYLGEITGYNYSFAIAAQRKWGNEESQIEDSDEGFYQLMPDGKDDGFFKWYCLNRPYYQFFKTKEMAIIHFVKFWFKWKQSK